MIEQLLSNKHWGGGRAAVGTGLMEGESPATVDVWYLLLRQTLIFKTKPQGCHKNCFKVSPSSHDAPPDLGEVEESWIRNSLDEHLSRVYGVFCMIFWF